MTSFDTSKEGAKLAGLTQAVAPSPLLEKRKPLTSAQAV